MGPETFDEVLGLEERFYSDGLRQGMEDGIKAGRIEGRTFGLEKGFEKYAESGKLYGRSLVWANRIPQLQKRSSQETESDRESPSSSSKLSSLPNNQRLVKHLKILHALAESESLSTKNTEDAVSEFDDRFKRAQAKAKIIERLTGEVNENPEGPTGNGKSNIEDAIGRNVAPEVRR